MATGAVELSRMVTLVSAIGVRRSCSANSMIVAVSVPSVRRSSLKAWLKEKRPLSSTLPVPVSSPLARSSVLIPLMPQNSAVPGLTFSVKTVVVRMSPSLTLPAEVFSLALDVFRSNIAEGLHVASTFSGGSSLRYPNGEEC